ncbi:MAG: inorganic diphosphatase [bacterium]|nr:inorganic diphosphatase [bacterium]MDZ4248194.1 inorganic diphosphatase [Patescibacteria group bacterium]
MNVVHDLTTGNPPDEINVFIEIPRGSKNKYELDEDTGVIVLDRVVPTAFVYPVDYGLVPRTHWHDGDAIDAMIINRAEPYYPGTVVPARPIAVLRMVDSGEKDEKVLCVPAGDAGMVHIKDKSDVSPVVLDEIKHFFEHYKDLQGKKVTIEAIEGRDAAVKVIEEGIALYEKKHGK